LQYQWPLALGIFKRQYVTLKSGYLLAFQADYVRDTTLSQTFQIRLLGDVGAFYNRSQEPGLSTRFEGKILVETCPSRSYSSPSGLLAARLGSWVSSPMPFAHVRREDFHLDGKARNISKSYSIAHFCECIVKMSRFLMANQ
jgi:hypothetical protein